MQLPIKGSAMQMIMLIVLVFYLLPLVPARVNSQTGTVATNINNTVKVDGKTCQQLLEAFWKMKDTMEGEDYQLIMTEKLNSIKEQQNQILSTREEFVEYHRESK